MNIPARALDPVDVGLDAERPGQRYFPAVDGLRFVAVSMVVAIHYLGMPFGWAGVDLFFVISGFLITGILWDTRESPHRWRNFYARRTLRIFPLYYGVLLLLAIVASLRMWVWHPGQLLYFAYLQNLLPFLPHRAYESGLVGPVVLSHFWSLAVEEQFYLLWPLIVFNARNIRRLIQLCWGVMAGCLALRLALYLICTRRFLGSHELYPSSHYVFQNLIAGGEGLLYRSTFTRADTLAAGALGALYMRTRHFSRLLRMLRWIAPVSLGIVVVLQAFQVELGSGMQTIGFTAIAFVALALLLLAVRPSFVQRIFGFGPLRKLGTWCYGIYIFHELPGKAIYNWVHPMPAWQGIPLAIGVYAGVIGIAALSYRFYETPFLSLKRHFVR